jgi:hypothetical protein
MKKVLLVFYAVIILALIVGCENPVDKYVMTNPPNKLIYITGLDVELDLSGGEITIHYGSIPFSSGYTRDKVPMDFHGRIVHDIDFTMPGVYIVTVVGGRSQNENQYDTFEIHVVTQEEYDAMMAQEE